MSQSSVCVVTPGYLSSNPRSVKEADVLHAAGYAVRVVFSQGNLADIRRHDEALIRRKPWRATRVRWSSEVSGERRLFYASKFRFYVSGILSNYFSYFDPMAESRVFPELLEAASSERANLYIGHYPAGLAVAAIAARRHGTKWGYDIEDLHAEEGLSLRQTRRIRRIESSRIRGIVHCTAASQGIADEIAGRYAPPVIPAVVHNVFSWSDRSGLDGIRKDRTGKSAGKISLYWFSQTVGMDRGIEDAILAMGAVGTDALELHLRGHCDSVVRERLQNLASQQGVLECLFFHDPVSPDELLSRSAEHDVGLALEQPISLNKQLTVSNKLFFYLLAGLAVAATDVRGQRKILLTCPEVGHLYKPGDWKNLADWLSGLTANPTALSYHKDAALRAARERWNWEVESSVLAASVRRALERKP